MDTGFLVLPLLSMEITRKEIVDSDIIERAKIKDKACLMKVHMLQTNSDSDQGQHLSYTRPASYVVTGVSISFRSERANWKRKEG